MAQPLFKLTILLFSINILLLIGGVRVIGNDDTNLVNNFLNVTDLQDGRPVPQSGFVDALPTTFGQSGSGVLDFIDGIGAVGKFIAFIVNIVFTPLGLFVGTGMPLEITLLVGMPIMVSMFVATAYFIRAGG